MGWDYGIGQTRKDLIAELCEPHTAQPSGRQWTTIAHAARGNVLWAVKEIVDPIGGGAPQRHIMCYLLARQKIHGLISWGYKDMDESAGPYYFSCPLPYLDMAPEPDGMQPYSGDQYKGMKWRELVREWHAARVRVRNAKVGDVLVLREGSKPARVIVIDAPIRKGDRNFTGEDEGGRYYRVPTRIIVDVETPVLAAEKRA